jgi:hypothetical protein
MKMDSSKTKVLLIDFSPAWMKQLYVLQGDFDFVESSTIWNGGTINLDSQGAEIVFVNADYQDLTSSAVHIGDGQQMLELLKSGGLVISFLGNLQSFHLANLIGTPISLGIANNRGPLTNCTVEGSSPLKNVFSRFGNRIEAASTITRSAGGPGITAVLRYGGVDSVGVTAKFEDGGGTLVLLPHFGNTTPAVVTMILKEILPELAPNLVYDETFAWIMRSEYLMPSLAAIRNESQKIDEDYAIRKSEIKSRYEEEWKKIQEPWNRLLTTSGDDLKEAVAAAMAGFEFKTVDVDRYWREKGIERKDEDLWIAIGVEPHPATEGTGLVEVKSSAKRTSSDDDYYGALIKYLSRAKTEFANIGLWGLLIVNHLYLTPANSRREAFDQRIVNDSVRDRVTLLTTYDLFQLGQRLLSGLITKVDVQKLLMTAGRLVLPVLAVPN